MDVKHEVSEDERRPERAEAALQERQKAEDAETLRVRGPQRPADNIAAAEAPAPTPTPTPTPPAKPVAPGRPVSPVTVRPKTVVAPGPAQPVTEHTAEKPADTSRESQDR